jgi:hypothetical protein
MDFESNRSEDLRELQLVLRRIVQRMTRQIFTTPRLTQMDVGIAISLVQRVEFPKAVVLRHYLPELLRDAAKRRADLHRYVLAFEDAIRDIENHLPGRG